MAGIDKVLGLLGPAAPTWQPVSHGTTVATNQLLEGKVGDLGFITTEGYEYVLEIARQRVPDGYGNSYFWVKPPRIVPGRPGRTVGGRLDFHGHRDPALRRGPARSRPPGGSATRASTRIGVCFLHSYANPAHELRDARGAAPRAPGRGRLDLVSEVLREYREYERSVTTLVDAAVKPNDRAATSRTSPTPAATSVGAGDVPFYVMKSNGGVLSAERGRAPADHHGAVRAGGRRARRGAGRPGRRASTGCSPATAAAPRPTCRVVLDGEPTLTTEGTVGAYPSKIPMIDVVTVGAGGGSIAWISPEGTLKVGPAVGRRRPRAALLRPRRHRADDHRRARGARPDPAAPARRRDPARRRRGPGRAVEALADRLGLGLERARDRHPGDLGLEPGQRAAPGHRQARPRRARLHHGRPSAAPARCWPAGWSTSSGCAGVAGAARPGQPVGVRPAHRRRPQRLRADRGQPGTPSSTSTLVAGVVDDAAGAGRGGAGPRGLRPRPSTAIVRTRRPALLRPGVRGAGAGAGRAGRRRRSPTRSPAPSTTRTSSSTATTSATTRGSRSSGSTCGSPASARSRGPSCAERRRGTAAPQRARTGVRPVLLRRLGRHPGLLAAPTSAPATWSTGRRSSRSSARPCRCIPASRADASTGSATWWSRREATRERPTVDARRPDPAGDRRGLRWRRSRWRSRPRSAAPRGRR